MENIILLGASGHSKVIIDILHCMSRKKEKEYRIALLDDDESLQGTEIMGHTVIGKISDCIKYPESSFLIAIGNNKIRERLAQEYDLHYILAIHPSAVIGENVAIGAGTVVMPGAIINSGTEIGRHCIINTGVTIDHDNQIGDFVHISPGAHLAGTVSVGKRSWLGIGSCCANNISMHSDVVIGAGGAVITDLNERGTYVGIPAKKIK